MGILDFASSLKNHDYLDVIRCDEPEYLVWKWRPKGQSVNSTVRENSIRFGSSLRVKDGEVAVFVYNQANGPLQDFIVGPYDDLINTLNFPVLADIVGSVYNGDSPFQAEIYFINTQGNNQLQFSVPYFDVSDPRLPDYPVPVSVHGTMTFALEDYKNFIKLNRLIDFNHEAFLNQIRDAVARNIKVVVANIPTNLSLPVVQLERRIDDICSMIEANLKARLTDFGVTMKHIDINQLLIDKTSEAYIQVRQLTGDITAKTMQAQAELNIKNMQETQRITLQNMEETMRIQREEAQRAQRLQSESNYLGAHALDQQASVLQTAAANLGQMSTMNMGEGGSAGGTMNPVGMMTGMMMGSAMGNQMAGMMGAMGQQMQNSMNTPPPIPTETYFVAVNHQQTGPFNLQQLQQMVNLGQLDQQTLVWKNGMAQWEAAGNVPELASLFNVPTPPPIP